MTPHSCEICETMFFFHQCHNSQGYWERMPEPEFSTAIEFGYWFCISFEETVELAEQGCDLMKWLATLAWPDTTPDCQLRAYYTHGSREQISLDFVVEIDDHSVDKDFSRRLVLCADPDDIAAKELNVRPPNLNPASIKTIESARYWFDTCINTHTMCPKPWSSQTGYIEGVSERMKPRRLIKLYLDMSSEKPEERLSLSLVETSAMSNPKYAALSYCWGGDQATKLSRSNLDTWFTSIPYEDLPLTIKDAARVTVGIGLEYLWIDALCIVQNDKDDQSIELAKMAEIYSQAQITLLASRSAKVEDGFLYPRTFASENSFRIPFMMQDDQIGSVILWNGRDLGASEPIDQRAWCFQERVLSHRILEFGTHLTRYRCATNRETKHPAETDGWIADSSTWVTNGTGHSISLPNNWSSLDPESDDFLELWGNIVAHYTGLEMSDPRDRLNAISGVARRFSKSSNELYCVGLWRKHLPQFLLWQASALFGEKAKRSRIDPYIAPSWSWASTTLPVGYNLHPSDTAIFCEILDISVRNSTIGDSFSNAVNATLTIRAPARAATLGWELPEREICDSTPCRFGWGDCDCKNQQAQYSASDYKERIVLEAETDLPNMKCACEEPVDERCNVHLIYIAFNRGLIVRQKSEDPKTYERIGVFVQFGFSHEILKDMDFVLV